MKDYNNYEKDLIKLHKNPKICIMSSGADWLYLNDLINKFYANITIIGTDPKLIIELDKMKDYDMMILDSPDPFSESKYHILLELAFIIQSKYHKDVDFIYCCTNHNKKIASIHHVNDIGVDFEGLVDGECNLRNLINVAYNSLNHKKKKKSK